MLEKGAIVQRDGETYAIAPHLPGGLVDADTLIKIGEVAKKYNAATLKVTNAQRIAIVGIKKEDVDKIWADLGMKPGAAIGLCVRSIKFCPGTTFCKRGQQDSVSLGMELDKRYHGFPLPGKFKIAVSGCANRCTDIAHRDIGIMGTPRGFNIYIGGTGGVIPREGELLMEHCTGEEVLTIVDQIINFYKENAQRNDRLGRLIDRIGFEKFKKEVLNKVSLSQ
ncbi:sulfite reductase [Anoxybacter fermentans]|uniref:Sulfite reductase n=1 Tax=Anoxybacter fermentans TaxID=1323375 RepID=A0A3Q9HSJ6_9FIRM|nr:sulfite reductase [Anoxybacter fermentans]